MVVERTDGDGLRIEHDMGAGPRIDEGVSRETPDVSGAHGEDRAAPVRRTRHTVVLDAALPVLDARADPRTIEV